MDRVTGWYKRNTHFLLFTIGLCLAVVLNVDTFIITTQLSKEYILSNYLAELSHGALQHREAPGDGNIPEELLSKNLDLVDSVLAVGWGDYGRADAAFILSIRCDEPGWVA